MKFIPDGLRRKAVTISDPFGGFRTVGPFEFARDNTPIQALSLGQLYESSAPAQSVVRTLANGVSGVRFSVEVDGDIPGAARAVGDRRLERALNDPKLLIACTTDLS